ncbi:hypothetical protein QBC47DRAFT_132577 [Echria macrotheca]|uniref:Ubiquitin-like domain-containing protein n=1 Tax=Echria macrotheca TaxID=438768 RepID=A0AAJ0BHI8_9PEZI|nr:hypothetical protein QBC47DRAFT_132577 [Echria macrotheca]
MTSVGDIIAILGLFERVILELRNYKDAPAHFQQLSIELDLLSSTLRHASQLRPSNDDERRTLDKVGAIAMHCLIPLQAMADKMRAKESSLGHFRTTRSLTSIGTRLHWSMIARKDIDGLRTTILSEMLAINMLLSSQQLGQIKRLSSDVECAGSAQSALIEKHSSALMRQTSAIFTIVAATPNAIVDLQSLTVTQAAKQSQESQAIRSGLEAVTKHMELLSIATNKSWTMVQRHADSLGKAVKRLAALMKDIRELFTFLATCSKEMLEAIGRNTLLLVHIANQMKRVVQVIEAIPRQVDVDVIRMDDALGDTWGLPLQACGSWNSFCNMLQHVVFAGRPGLHLVTAGQFAITLAGSGTRIDQHNWFNFIKRDAHIQQAMVVSRAITGKSSDAKRCPFPGCAGELLESDRPGTCSSCGRHASSKREGGRVIKMLGWQQASDSFRTFPVDETAQDPTGPQLPAMQLADEFQHFRRVHISEPVEPVQDMDEALSRLLVDSTDAIANAFIGLHHLVLWEGDTTCEAIGGLDVAERCFQRAVESDPSAAEHWYLLGRANLRLHDFRDSYESMQQAVYRKPNVPEIWLSIAILYYELGQPMDSLDALSRSIRLKPFLGLNWYNLGILYDSRNQVVDALDSFARCVELNPDLPSARARLEVLQQHVQQHVVGSTAPPDDHKIYEMLDSDLKTSWDEYIEPLGNHVLITPLVEEPLGSDGVDGEFDFDDTTDDSASWESTDDDET